MLVSRLLEVMSHLRQELFTLHETNWSFIRIIQWIVCKGDYDSQETWDTKWTTLNPTPVQTIEHAYTVALRYFAIWLQLNPFSRLNLLMLWPSPTHPLWLPLYASFPHYTECTIHPYTSINEAVVGMVVGIVDWVFPPTKWTVSFKWHHIRCFILIQALYWINHILIFTSQILWYSYFQTKVLDME